MTWSFLCWCFRRGLPQPETSESDTGPTETHRALACIVCASRLILQSQPLTTPSYPEATQTIELILKSSQAGRQVEEPFSSAQHYFSLTWKPKNSLESLSLSLVILLQWLIFLKILVLSIQRLNMDVVLLLLLFWFVSVFLFQNNLLFFHQEITRSMSSLLNQFISVKYSWDPFKYTLCRKMLLF